MVIHQKKPLKDKINSIKVYTTRPDTLMGASFLAIAPEHKLCQIIDDIKVQSFIKKLSNSVSEADIASAEKVGIFTGLFALHPYFKQKNTYLDSKLCLSWIR
jgi:leucyl-tRNA synthetase